MARDDVPPGAAFAYDVTLRALDQQLARIASLDSKAGVLIAADGVLIGLLIAGRPEIARFPALWSILALGGTITSFLLALMCLRSGCDGDSSAPFWRPIRRMGGSSRRSPAS